MWVVCHEMKTYHMRWTLLGYFILIQTKIVNGNIFEHHWLFKKYNSSNIFREFDISEFLFYLYYTFTEY